MGKTRDGTSFTEEVETDVIRLVPEDTSDLEPIPLASGDSSKPPSKIGNDLIEGGGGGDDGDDGDDSFYGFFEEEPDDGSEPASTVFLPTELDDTEKAADAVVASTAEKPYGHSNRHEWIYTSLMAAACVALVLGFRFTTLNL